MTSLGGVCSLPLSLPPHPFSAVSIDPSQPNSMALSYHSVLPQTHVWSIFIECFTLKSLMSARTSSYCILLSGEFPWRRSVGQLTWLSPLGCAVRLLEGGTRDWHIEIPQGKFLKLKFLKAWQPYYSSRSRSIFSLRTRIWFMKGAMTSCLTPEFVATELS